MNHLTIQMSHQGNTRHFYTMQSGGLKKRISITECRNKNKSKLFVIPGFISGGKTSQVKNVGHMKFSFQAHHSVKIC